MKRKLSAESGQPYEDFVRLKLKAADNKLRETDAANSKQLLRIIQSVPSPNAEPLKQWLAQVGSERLDEIADPEKAITRGRETYRKKGYSEEWIKQRENAIDIRNDLTDEWKRVGIEEGMEYAILTNEITHAWSGMSTNEYKQFKGMQKGNLRDNMTNLELVLNMLAEATTTEISKVEDPDTFDKSKEIANRGGGIAGNTRKEIEDNLGRSVLSKNNSDNPELLDDDFRPKKTIRKRQT